MGRNDAAETPPATNVLTDDDLLNCFTWAAGEPGENSPSSAAAAAAVETAVEAAEAAVEALAMLVRNRFDED